MIQTKNLLSKGQEKRAELTKKYTFLQTSGDRLQDLMMFGFECADGWLGLIEEICQLIQKGINEGKVDKDIKVSQIKEKYGRLEFYCGGLTDEIFKEKDKIEEKSLGICEITGKKGSTKLVARLDGEIKVIDNNEKMSGGWYYTLSDRMFDEMKKGKSFPELVTKYNYYNFYIIVDMSTDKMEKSLIFQSEEEADKYINSKGIYYGAESDSENLYSYIKRKLDEIGLEKGNEIIKGIVNNIIR